MKNVICMRVGLGVVMGVMLCSSVDAQQVGLERASPPVVPNTPPNGGKPRLPLGRDAAAELPKLLVGDAAPALSIEKWVKGEPVLKFESGKVYVVEFWATWCRPCKDSIPHLTELQAKHKDAIRVIGVTSLEQDGVAGVEALVKRLGDKVGYTIAWDDAGKSNQAWMAAAAQDGIPTAFVVEKTGKVAWIGHPMDGLDDALERVLSGSLDLSKESAAARVRAEINLKAAPLKLKLNQQMENGQFEEAVGTMDQLVALSPEQLGEYSLAKFVTLSANLRDSGRAYSYANEAIGGVLKDNAQILGALAWAIAEHPSVERRDFVVAERAAARANELTLGKSPLVLSALARVAVERGQMDKAVEYQSAAVGAEANQSLKAELQERLDGYQRRQQQPKK